MRGSREQAAAWAGAAVCLVLTLFSCAPRGAVGREGLSPAPGAPPRLLWVQGPEGRLRVEDGGRGGIPVVFVHGLGGDRRVWAAQLEHLRKTRRAIALDLRGHGESDPSPDPRGAYAPQGFAEDVEAVANALGLKRFVLVGHSLGGAVVGAYAGDHPGRVAGLLFDDPVGALNQIPRASMESWLEGFSSESYDAYWPVWLGEMLAPAKPEVRDQVLKTFASTTPEAVRAAIMSLSLYDPVPALERYRGPMLTVVTPENTKPFSLHNAVAGLPYRIVQGTSHWIMMDDPTAFNAILDEFLQKLR
ncbi:MAG: alpha/beta fold hydrolase [Acidobacteriota bacterium]